MVPGTASGWLLPALGYMVVLGFIGLVTKVAMRTSTWPTIILWTALVYAVVAALMVAGGQRISLESGWWWAALSGLMAAGGLMVFFIALDRGEVTRVVPVTSGYPVIATIAGALILGERVTPARVVGVILVVVGVVFITSSR